MKQITLDEYKQTLVELLIKFDKFCEENNLHYSLIWGTMLGAVRHKGFIPWDDDLDVGMPMDDYLRFLEIIKTKEVTFAFDFCEKGRDYFNYFAKIYDTSVVLDFDKSSKMGNLKYYAYIDVFPLFHIDENDKYIKPATKVNRLLVMYHYYSAFPHSGSFKERLRFFVKYIQARLYGKKKLISLSNRYLYKIAEQRNDKYVGDFVDPIKFPIESTNEYIDIDFEKHKFKCFKDYDTILTCSYGDYMTPPPEKDRVPCHHFNAYKVD